MPEADRDVNKDSIVPKIRNEAIPAIPVKVVEDSDDKMFKQGVFDQFDQ